MFDSLNTRITRLYNNIIGRVKNINTNRQTLPGDKNPEFIHALSVAPEYHVTDKLAFEVSQQLCPTTADSIRNTDIGSLEEWGERVLGRVIGVNESIEDYRSDVLQEWRPDAAGGNREDILDWSLEVSGVRRVYSYIGSLGVDAITVTDIEGRLAGSSVYVRADSGNGVPSITLLKMVFDELIKDGSISFDRARVVPIIIRPYDFTFQLKANVTGGSSPLSEVQNKVLDIVFDVLDKTEPYIKYVDDIRRDFVIVGQYLNEIRNVITKPPYRYTLEDIRIFQNGIEVQIEQLPAGNIPIMGSYNFV